MWWIITVLFLGAFYGGIYWLVINMAAALATTCPKCQIQMTEENSPKGLIKLTCLGCGYQTEWSPAELAAYPTPFTGTNLV